MPTTHYCLSCKSDDLYENKIFGSLPRVTSDTVPFPSGGRLCICLKCGLVQKIIDERWLSEINNIYSNYKLYELTDGSDQVLFSAGGMTRAEKIVDILSQQLAKVGVDNIIDIGCGTGGFLRAFGAKFPNAALYGNEIDDKNIHHLNKIPNFRGLFTAKNPHINKTFNVITSIHCFEHWYNYADFFTLIDSVCNDNSVILLEVPDIDTSPFDIAIADHAAHFSTTTLARCLKPYLQNFTIGKPINKELTVLSSKKIIVYDEAKQDVVDEKYVQILDGHINYLVRLLELIDEQKLSEFGVYGTSIAGTWLTGAYSDKIAFYVDDDPLKQGKTYCGKKVIPARQVPDNCKVFLPFDVKTINSILSNNPNLLPLAIYCK